ncbi:glycoside hydrolase family 19 protein [Burkholderia lata]|uniref:glycoside hydrolase family 19 protein n=1 Tax=Burkholderia lata (strain ATCC 17760 / DSM 23089 / LMG 22485 / NCIMB 9086 / R18194 / 383) TaxID=482957 RepID=UPI0014548C92|nr:glycoside hydrolase family 19 protein [Burkholderia lata]VWC14317.1 EF hand domain-containing protein [Burkholderia lata]
MANPPAPKKPQSPTPAPAKLKPLPFAFPFLRKGTGKNEASAQFTDEHEIYRLLAEREPSGTYLVSRKGMWHGGIHVTEAGAGQSLDLDAGLRCIADGTLVAFRANKTYPISEVGEAGSESLVQAPYSTGFALVQHTMEFPRDTKLTFYSLYMHLMSLEDYANFPKRRKPAYWPRQWRVTRHAEDKPSTGRNGQVPDPSQQGLRVRKSHPRGEILGLLPQGASVSIGKREKNWGQVTDLHGASLLAPETGGYAEPSSAVGGWVFLGQENGGPTVEEVIEDSMFDRVIVMTEQAGQSGDSRGIRGGIPIKAGDPIGHLGRYDSLNECASGTRMAHIEVFCDDSIQSFVEQGRAWVDQRGPHKEDWSALGLPSEPTILRIAPGTVLYQRQGKKFVPGADPQSRKTDTVQVYSLSELAREPQRRVAEPKPNPNPGYPVNWWHVEGVNAQGQLIDGWVCDFNHPSGRVTREFAQKWIDFQCLADAHDPTHTIFTTTQKWVDYASGANVADHASRSNLSPVMLKVYDTLFTKGDGKLAVDELCTLSQTERGGYPWLMQTASRFIVKHESEWANPSKWKQLIAELEKQTGPKPQHEEEQKRIDKLAWWDEVKAGVPGFPGPEVFHGHPLGVVSNFISGKFQFTVAMMRRIFPGAQDEILQGVVAELNSHIEVYKLNSSLRRSHFFAQVRQETGASLTLEEGFVWRAESLIENFSYFKKNPKIARAHGYEKKKGVKADGSHMTQDDFELIANGAYGGRAELGNGDYDSGDGWRYRGRGMKHVTGRANYREFNGWNKKHQAEWPEDDVNFEESPDLLMQPKYAVRSAAYFWVTRGLPEIADRGATSDQVNAITAIVNKNTDSYGKRVKNFEEINGRGDLN